MKHKTDGERDNRKKKILPCQLNQVGGLSCNLCKRVFRKRLGLALHMSDDHGIDIDIEANLGHKIENSLESGQRDTRQRQEDVAVLEDSSHDTVSHFDNDPTLDDGHDKSMNSSDLLEDSGYENGNQSLNKSKDDSGKMTGAGLLEDLSGTLERKETRLQTSLN